MRAPTLLALICALAACGDEGPRVAPSGFLGDMSQLEAGGPDEAQLIYINPEAHFARYERILVDPVVFWGEAREELPPEADELAADFGALLRKQLAHEFELADAVGPGTLRFRTAITAVHADDVSVELEVLDSVSGERLVAVADAREDREAGGGSPGSAHHEAFAHWAGRARTRLAAFRDFDAAEAAHEQSLAQ